MTRLDLGAGDVSPEGFVPMGAAHGSAIHPLPVADGSADVIRASHCLEHFPHGQIADVLAGWVRALKPGGELKIAVPDFRAVAAGYLAGAKIPTEGYVMGGQVDGNDFHKAIFDREHLRGLMAAAGLVMLQEWTSEIDDCAALPISLNLSGRKPHRSELKVRGVMTAPRLGFNDMWQSAIVALPKLGIDFTKVGGAFWDHGITLALEQTLADPTIDYVLTMDYDSVFTAGHVARLLELAMVHPEVDAIAPMQASRHTARALFGVAGPEGETESVVAREEVEVDMYPARQAHFGLTLIKADKIRALAKPWFVGTPDKSGGWGDGKLDPDIHFWRQWEAAGNTLRLAPRVVIGHLEVMVRWPGVDLSPIWQSATDWESARKAPAGAWTGY